MNDQIAMDTERLAHLPDRKRRELQHAVRILFEEFEDAQKTKLSDKARRGRILKLVLFGSYARSDWVEDRGSGYLSDYDLLVVVNDARFAEPYEAWEKAEERLLQELSLGGRLATPVNVIVHTYQDVNDQLAQGRPFFVDIARTVSCYTNWPVFRSQPRSRSRRRSSARRRLGTSSTGSQAPATPDASNVRHRGPPTETCGVSTCIRPPNGCTTASFWS